MRRSISLVLVGVMSVLLFVVILLTTDAHLPLWLKNQIEMRMDAAYVDGHVHLGAVRIAAISNGADPVVTLEHVVIRDNAGQVRARLPEIQAVFSGRDILSGKFNAISVEIGRAAFNLVRDTQGRIDIVLDEGGESSSVAEDRSIADLLNSIREGFEAQHLVRLERITSSDIKVTLRDEMTRRIWTLHHGLLDMVIGPKDISGEVAFRLDNEDGSEASATFRLIVPRDASGANFDSRFNGFRAIDLADQVPAFGWLRVLDAPIAGALAMEITADGKFGDLNGVLDVGAGQLLQGETNLGSRFTAAKAYLRYDPKIEKFRFDQVLLDTEAAHFVAEGDVYLSDRIDRVVGGIIAQLRFSKALINPEGVFGAPLELDLGVLDVRVQLEPLQVDIGQLVLVKGEEKLSLNGQLSLGQAGWTSAIDLAADQIRNDTLLSVWPVGLVPKTRAWIEKNIHHAKMENLRGSARLAPGVAPDINVGFDVREANFNFLKFLPPVEDGVGYGVLTADAFDIVLQSGTLTAPVGGVVNMSGSHFSIPNLKIKPAPAFADIKTQSSLTALLSVLDLPPFSFLEKAGTKPDLADGTVTASGRIDFPLSDKVTFDQIDLQVEGVLRNVTSDKLVKGKTLRADQLAAKVDNSGITISGNGLLGRLDVSGFWRQDFGPTHKGKSRFEGQIEISEAFLEEFGIGLPKGSVSGKGIGTIAIGLRRGQSPEFSLRSDLNRVGMNLAALGWSKPAASLGALRADGSFGTPPAIRKLTLEAAGLSASGAITLQKGGKLNKAVFETVKIKPWLDTAVTIQPGPGDQTMLIVRGGLADFRSAKFGRGGGGDEGKGLRIDIALDRLVISSGIALTGFSGDLVSKSGLSGAFSARVNGGAAIVGGLAPLKNGTAVRFTSEDAGAVMKSANIFSSAVGGRMDMTLIPRPERGEYDGSMKITNVRARNASTLAGLLSAISVVGLLEQLGGEGIHFANVDARFRLTPDGVTLHESSAVGASLGLTMEGVYRFTSATIDMQGVLTPIYVLNGILEQAKIFGGLFGRKTGEGLFGFNYTLKGSVKEPRVGVNPLSILTPGLFREIFRQPPPAPPKAGE